MKRTTRAGTFLTFMFCIFFQLQMTHANGRICEGFHRSPNSISFYDEVFRAAYPLRGKVYRPGQCGRNIKELLLILEEQGLNLKNTSVIYLLREKQKSFGNSFFEGDLKPAHNRDYQAFWFFHVVLRVTDAANKKDYILDLDGPPQAMSIANYFSRMFPGQPGEDRLARISMREIPTEDYLQAFQDYYEQLDPRFQRNDNQVVGVFRKPEMPLYPVLSVREYLNRPARR